MTTVQQFTSLSSNNMLTDTTRFPRHTGPAFSQQDQLDKINNKKKMITEAPSFHREMP
jgi:hypothetical protein